MGTIYNIIFACLDAALSYITISYLFSAFSLVKKITFSFYHLLAIALCVLNNLIPVPAIASVVCVLLVSLLISIPYKLKWFNAIFVSFFIMALTFLSEMLVGVAMMAIFSMSFGDTVEGAAYFIGLILSRFIAYIVSYVIKVSKHKLFHKEFRKKWLLIFILPIATVLVCGVLFKYISIGQAESEFVIFVILSLLVASNVFIFYFIDDIYESIVNKEKLNLAQNLIKQQEKQYKELYANSRELRKLRHNYKNFLLGVIAEIEKENYDNIKKSFDSELGILNVIPAVEIQTGNATFDSLLNYKVAQASQYGINFEFEFQKMSKVNFSDIDLAVLIGNAIDNAIEATAQVENEQEKIIEFSAKVNNSQLIISIINPTDKDVDVLNLSTNKKDVYNHGFGVLTMMQIVQKYQGDVVFNYENKKFETIIYISLSEGSINATKQGQITAI